MEMFEKYINHFRKNFSSVHSLSVQGPNAAAGAFFTRVATIRFLGLINIGEIFVSAELIAQITVKDLPLFPLVIFTTSLALLLGFPTLDIPVLFTFQI